MEYQSHCFQSTIRISRQVKQQHDCCRGLESMAIELLCHSLQICSLSHISICAKACLHMERQRKGMSIHWRSRDTRGCRCKNTKCWRKHKDQHILCRTDNAGGIQAAPDGEMDRWCFLLALASPPSPLCTGYLPSMLSVQVMSQFGMPTDHCPPQTLFLSLQHLFCFALSK